MRSAFAIGSLLLLRSCCNDNTSTFQSIVIYENPQAATGAGNLGNVGSDARELGELGGGSGNYFEQQRVGRRRNSDLYSLLGPWAGKDQR